MTPTVTTINLPSDLVQALDELAEATSLSREELLTTAVTQFLAPERALQELRTELQAAAKRRGIETEKDLYAFLESDD